MKTLLFIEQLHWIDPILPDEVLDYWGEIYLANPRVRAADVDFETFLQAPRRILEAVTAAPIAPERVGLLPVQRAVRRRVDLDQDVEQLALALDHTIVALEGHVANGAVTEKLRHHAWPRHKAKRQALEV